MERTFDCGEMGLVGMEFESLRWVLGKEMIGWERRRRDMLWVSLTGKMENWLQREWETERDMV